MKTFKVAHLNMNFHSNVEADRRALWGLLIREGVDLLTLNEAKDRNIELLLTQLGIQTDYVVLQDRSSAARAGCAIVFKRSTFRKTGRFRRHLAIRAGRRRMLDRYVVDVRLRLRGTRFVLRAATGHNAPGWYADLQPVMDAVVARLVFGYSRIPVIFGTDANRRIRHQGFRGRTLRRFIARLGLTAYGHPGGIDYLMAEDPIRLQHVRAVTYRGQDHPALIGRAVVD